MPIYEYQCDDCNSKFEKYLKNRDEIVTCPDCGSSKVDKAHSTFAAKVAAGAKACAMKNLCPGAAQGGCGCGGGKCGGF